MIFRENDLITNLLFSGICALKSLAAIFQIVISINIAAGGVYDPPQGTRQKRTFARICVTRAY